MNGQNLLFDLRSYFDKLRSLFFRLKDDPPFLEELRRLFLAFLVFLSVAYGGYSFLVEPIQRENDKKLKELLSLRGVASGEVTPMLDAGKQKLSEELGLLQEENAILELKNRFLKEQWRIWGDSDRFTRIIMTLDSAAPLSMDRNFKQITRLEPQAKDDFTVHPLRVTGSASFASMLAYLHYLEKMPEVGLLDELVLDSIPTATGDRSGKISFSFVAGRVVPELGDER